MIVTLPTRWRGRALAVGLAILAVAAAYIAVVSPLRDLYGERAKRIETRRALQAKLYAVAGELPALRMRLASLRVGTDGDKLTLPERSDAVASAALQGHVEEVAAARGVRIGSSESLPAQIQGTYHRIGLRLALSAPYGKIINLLAALETMRPPLIIAELQFHGFQRLPDKVSDSPLDASLALYGFRADEIAMTAKR